jgi:hypothetical protein
MTLESMFQAYDLSLFWKVSRATFKHQLKRYDFYTYFLLLAWYIGMVIVSLCYEFDFVVRAIEVYKKKDDSPILVTNTLFLMPLNFVPNSLNFFSRFAFFLFHIVLHITFLYLQSLNAFEWLIQIIVCFRVFFSVY